MLKRNITANYISQLYVTGVGILILPLYIKYMGAEAYGLVGFFAMLQAWFAMLDLGLTPTIARETARYHGGSMTALIYRQLLRALTLIFIGIALIGGGILLYMADSIAAKWLTVELLSLAEVKLAVQIMAISVALRWLCGLYRGVITGSEKLVLLSSFNVVIATFRFIAVFASMWHFGFTAKVFFIHQLAVAVIELLGLFIAARGLIPKQNMLENAIGWSFKPVKPVLKFALTIAFTSSVWVLVTQTDKLILSGILPLTEYGYFTLAVLVASGIMVISGPVSIAIMPRMARLHAEGKHEQLIKVYRTATQLVSVIAGSAAIVIAFYAEQLIFSWTGEQMLAEESGPILRLYVIGNSFLAISAFPYYLQYAIGNLRYHLIGNAFMVVLLIPAIIFAAINYGAIGAGYVWALINGLYLVVWVGYVHYKLEPGLHSKWLIQDGLIIYGSVILLLSFLSLWPIQASDRLLTILQIFAVSALALITAVISADSFRKKLILKIKSVF
ncbi:oligosaccharide flippase family protein [Rheinheimera salexigens]|uniref:Polysaccharide biosynthesis protein n=1 Tax=Rheinheimera salexigens TaxID=1628148 RepID=A0A1E7Q4Z9_9GAMM|nr:oligosaccharide flippase family protein [Rheinheimera salexigens]OEY69216.1 polysaccharide biosynthesis protein [Rheinheimera salexigens]